MRTLTFVWLLGFVFPASAEPPKGATDLEKFQGEWVMVGLDIQESFIPAEKLTGTTLVVKKNTYTTVVKKKAYPVTFTLDPKPEPRHIDMMIPDGSGAPQLSKGIYKFDGDKLVICRGQAAGGDRPRSFASSLTNDVFVVTWERVARP
jgi:uncharacterized protein (TIGR03067 family)